MCGIAGILSRRDQRVPELRPRLQAMATSMAHRGPDDEGIFVTPDGRCGIVNRRLAIRDLSPAGHMPMAGSDGAVQITYNGEIYNAGVLRAELEAAGPHASARRATPRSFSEGMKPGARRSFPACGACLPWRFSICAQDPSAPRLLLARDHLGIKPLYYAQTGDAFLFASELKVLLASGLVSREVDPAGLVGYLQLGSVPNPLTIYREITALPPASRLWWTPAGGGMPDPDVYWSLPEDEFDDVDPDEALAQVEALLAEAVAIRLVSDVPLGAFLSGGLDSSAVVALMRQASAGPLRTCSMVFEEAAYSEAPYARAMAEAVGAEHFERVVTAADLRAGLDQILAAMDQPTIDGVNTWFVSQTARQAGLTVALSGLGGDELFGGYPNTFDAGAPALPGPAPGGAAARRARRRRGRPSACCRRPGGAAGRACATPWTRPPRRRAPT